MESTDYSLLGSEESKEYDETVDELVRVLTEARQIWPESMRPFDRFFPARLQVHGKEIICSLTRGVTLFGLTRLAEDRYSKYDPPANEEDLFVEVRFEERPSPETVDSILQAYLFELSTSLGIDLEVIEVPDPSPSDEDTTEWTEPHYRLRPLLIGRGMTEPLRIYHHAITTSEPGIQVLLLTKAIEYISQTVVHQQSIQAIRTKLLSPDALDPNAQFITQLTELVEEQRSFRKDREALRLTIQTCCDATELAPLAPPFLKDLIGTLTDITPKSREKYLDAFGLCLADTRNSIAHAKANYTLTGNECPEDQLFQFTKCVKLATQQVIRWYASQSDIVRVT